MIVTMPACTEESISKLWNHREDIVENDARPGSESNTSMSPPSSPASPSRSPPITSPMPSIRRIKQENKVPFRRVQSASSEFPLIQEPFLIKSDRRDILATASQYQQRSPVDNDVSDSYLVRIIGWYPYFLLRVARVFLGNITEIDIGRVLLAVPTFWISLWISIFWKLLHIPLIAFMEFLSFIFTPLPNRFGKKQTVLISGGSTIQALKLARNFYMVGVRVIVCEIDEVFSLTWFSTAVTKFYNVPRPNNDNPKAYIQALCDIVQKENISFYIPVCATNSSYYDSLAKPYLELLGCTCYCPGVKESWMFDNVLELLRRCRIAGLATPLYYEVNSREEVGRLYDTGAFITSRYVIHATGTTGVRERTKIVLPLARDDFIRYLPQDFEDKKPWAIIQHVAGERFLTCTTVKGSHVVANVTCRINSENGSLIPVENKEITNWLRNFFGKLRSLRPITGHMSFRFIVSSAGNVILPVGCRVGVSLPYICHTSAHAKILRKPCRHFMRQQSGPLSLQNSEIGRWVSELKPVEDSIGGIIDGGVLDKREALFVYWDPLPYCAYYHMQLPFQNVLGFVQRGHRDHFARTLAAPVH